MSSLVECFSIIRDPRQESKIDHELIDILILCVLAVIDLAWKNRTPC